jgi:hypothetical protein
MMTELLDAAVSAPNIIPTALLVFVLIYWLVVILGAIDLDFFDVDVDLEADADGELSVSWLNHVLVFFNLGQVPFMLFLTFLVVPWWAITVLGNHYIGNESFVLSLLVLIPALLISLFFAKFLTMPFVRVYQALDQEDNTTPVGKICRITSAASPTKVGQAQVQTNGAPLVLNVRAYEGSSLLAGDSAMVIEYDAGRNVYLVEPYIS